MSNHINIAENPREVPYYAVHNDSMIAGFFGNFSFLSNFYVLENGIWYEELTYPSVEHAYQAAKWPVDKREQFLGVTPGQAKKLGRMFPMTNTRKWDRNKISLMEGLVKQKFSKNYKLQQMLFMTEQYHLEERNSWGDRFWGTDEKGIGKNNLGQILMRIRNDMKHHFDEF